MTGLTVYELSAFKQKIFAPLLVLRHDKAAEQVLQQPD